MKHISVILLEIVEQQFNLQARLSEHEALIRSLSDSPNIDIQASLPMLEDGLNSLSQFNRRINQSVQAVSRQSRQ